MTISKNNTRVGKDKWQHGRKGGRALCPRCKQFIKAGEWVRHAPGRLGTIRHAYSCPRGGVR